MECLLAAWHTALVVLSSSPMSTPTSTFWALMVSKEEAPRAGRRREEPDWVKEITRELREIGREIKEEIGRMEMKIKEELRELRTQLEGMEKKMTEEKKRGEEGWSKGWGRDWSEGSTDTGVRNTEGTDNSCEDKKSQGARQKIQGTTRAVEKKGDGGRDKIEKDWRRPLKSDRRKEQEEERNTNRLRRMRKKNLIWRKVVGGPKERKEMLETIMEEVTRRMIPIRKVLEVIGADGKIIMFMELDEEEDKEEVIEKCDEIWRRWKIGVDEELTFEERAYRHKLVEKAREERMKGSSVVLTNRRMWINGREVK
ncbi:golgin subfamily A member 6-like protein 2 [Temnothorax curvispinosus]|uniref:Golgin subfamily A member 6-like protein 2 n=1 Tax=Temnothorax curvispinosus TaxID=300111 RepID=A0A6J1RFR8_9HYME|nr:golgin subfamily A member 6-like protein 2 [Temnothorax curvispinosus]